MVYILIKYISWTKYIYIRFLNLFLEFKLTSKTLFEPSLIEASSSQNKYYLKLA